MAQSRAELLQKLELAELKVKNLQHDLNNAIAAKQMIEQLLEIYNADPTSQG